ncbi:MAG: isocitrate/isopropylmalate dehydrogenase family protein [Candidatus Aenigmarchaeota archaeon]|nr:isocitrate/isopropylmalate dehydrogenase family protein [Candidatus Aenigmarchaeota archaeon]
MHTIAVLPGDGIGPEVTAAAVQVLAAAQRGFTLELVFADAGAGAIEKHGTNLPAATQRILKRADACLKGPMTTLETPGAPVSAAVRIRRMFDLYANVRPCRGNGVDLVIVRENTEGLYAGRERPVPGGAVAERLVTSRASRRIAAHALALANRRRKKLTYVHKANILRMTDGVFVRAVLSQAKRYPRVAVEGMHVDAAAMQLVKAPHQFDVLVTTNLFGDILSDEAAQVAGGVGLAPSANIGDRYGMFEPVHGSAPKYAGKGIANPVGMIRAAALMLDFLGEARAAARIERAVQVALASGKARTRDLGGRASTQQAGKAIAEVL